MAVRRVLLADDEELYLDATARLLAKSGYECITARTGDEAIRCLEQQAIDMALIDLQMPGNENLELLVYLRQQARQVPVVVVTGHPSLPSAIESLRLRVDDYLLKPVAFDDLLKVTDRLLSAKSNPLTEELAENSEPQIVAQSPAMQKVMEIVHRVAHTDVNILITGESGTGKEVIAREIHRLSHQRKGIFQPIDCAAIPEGLLESVLFGHARGAFTGAVKDQAGLLQMCHDGTAFLDEIGELPITVQVKFLRTIQNEAFLPVGNLQEVRINTRFISATSRDLDLEVAEGRFRRDLYYRLAVIHLRLPSLRERREDIIPLARQWLRRLQAINPCVQDFSEAAWNCLLRHTWPGNVRELRNVIERGLSLAHGAYIDLPDLPDAIVLAQPSEASRQSVADPGLHLAHVDRESAERLYFSGLLQQHDGNVSKAAQQAGLSRQGLYRLLRKHNLEPQSFRKSPE